jgi:hypothetical protein
MIGTLIAILIAVIIIGVLWWAIQTLMGVIPIAEPWRTVAHVVLVLIAVIVVIWIIIQLLGMIGIHVPMGFR